MARGEVDARFDFVNFDRLYNELGDRLVAASRAALEYAGEAVVTELQACTPYSYGGPNSFYNSWSSRTIDVSSRLKVEVRVENTSPHAKYTEFGRGPGKQPPFKAIAEWAQTRGIIGPLLYDDDYDVKKVKKYKDAPLTAVGISAGRKRSARAMRELVKRSQSIKRYGDGSMHDFSNAALRKARGLVFGIMRRIGKHGLPGYQILYKHQAALKDIAITALREQLPRELWELRGRV